MRPVFKAGALSALILAAMWASGLHVYDAEKMRDALGWRWAVLSGESPFRWPLDAPGDLIHGHGLERFTWSGGAVRGDMADPYFYLSLEGRLIDARRYAGIRLRLWTEEANFLQLFHHQLREDEIHGSGPIALAAGWQTVVLDLPALSWQVKDLRSADLPLRDSAWGGAGGLVSALRIDPVETGGFEVDWIELKDGLGGPAPPDSVVPFRNLTDPLFDEMRQDPGGIRFIAQDRLWRTPESAHRTRMIIAREFPSAIVFPRVPTADQLAEPPGPEPRASWHVPALAYLLALLAFAGRKLLLQPWRSMTAVLSLFVVVEAFLYLAPHFGSAGRFVAAVPLLAVLWDLKPKPLAPQLFGEARAWLLVSPLLAAAVAELYLFPYQGPGDFSLPHALGLYFLWALFQQFVVAVLVLTRLQAILGPGAVVLSAGFFGFLHFPNFALMATTILLGIVLLAIYRRTRNLLAIAAAHALLAVGFNSLALDTFWLSRTIGPYFLPGL